MKLSILIPTYNYDPSQLVCDLQRQLPVDAEIIVGDDCSMDNSQWTIDNEKVRLYRPSHNLGRAAIRNQLAREAKGEWLLFIDADAQVRSDKFIENYLKFLPLGQSPVGSRAIGERERRRAKDLEEAGAICGGTGNLPSCPRPAARLRYDYEVKAENRLTLSHRRAHPYEGFTTFNFLIQRELFLSILFDETLKEYGHEDTLFGLELKKRGIPVLHIDNKLTHLGLEDADEYLQKTETALRSLARMPMEQKQNVRVSALAEKLNRG